jgi:enediyne biosynthesis protein E4
MARLILLDGDQDLFIGGRSIAGKYGVTPRSYIYLNDGKANFTELKKSGIDSIGMVTDAVIADFDGDKNNELLVAGYYMPLQIYQWQQNTFKLIKSIDNSNGWWNCIEIADFNGDGKTDIIGGNFGLNSKLTATEKQPLALYVNDFDKNGQSETVLTYYKSDNKSYPLHLKGEFVSQMPSMKKKFLYYKDYAGKGIDEIFSNTILSNTSKLSVTELETLIFLNQGNGQFEKIKLPTPIQLSPVYSIVMHDFNNDGKQDFFAAGNFSGVKPEIGSLNGNYGALCINKNGREFEYIPSAVSGLHVRGEARDGLMIRNAQSNPFLLVAMNNERPYLFKLKPTNNKVEK